MMQIEFSAYYIPLLVAALLSVVITIYAWIHRSTRGAKALSFLSFVIGLWTIGYIFEILGADLAAKYRWGSLQYVGIALAPYAWMIFSIIYNDETKLNSRRFFWLTAIIPVITILLALTTKWHGLIWSEYHINEVGEFSVLGVSYGPWFWVHFAYSYIVLLVGAIQIVLALQRRQGLYRGQIIALLAAVLAPWIGNALYLTGNSPIPYIDLTPLAFTITSIALLWAVFGFRLVDIVPIARDLVVDGLREGLIVVDLQGRIVDINVSAARLVGLPAQQSIGKPVLEVLQPWKALIERFHNALDTQDVVEIGTGEARRKLGVRISALHDKRNNLVGRVISVWELELDSSSFQSVVRIEKPSSQSLSEEQRLPEVPTSISVPGHWVTTFFSPPLIEVNSSLHTGPHWTQTIERVFTIIARTLAFLGSIALFIALPFAPQTEKVLYIILAGLIAIMWWLGMARHVSFSWRIIVFFLGLYALTIREIAFYGYSPEGFALSLTFVTLAVLLAGLRGWFHSLSAILATLTILGVSISAGWYQPPLISPELTLPASFANFMQSIVVFSVMAAVLTTAAYTLLNSLSRSQQRETQTLNLLQQERDLLEQRVIERTNELAKARDQALDASKFKSQLLARVSHELRTPLSGVLGFAELMKINAYGVLNERQNMAASNIIESAHHLTDMVNDLLDEAQIEAGTILLHNASFSPTELLNDVNTTLSVLTERKGLSYISECSHDLPDQMYGDVKRLRQVIINLAGNAVKFTQAGEVSIRFFCQSREQWAIQVSDTGVGISSDAQKYIFDAFRQVNNNITRENRGSGLGLSITKQLVELIGGRITVESVVGKGSTFTVILPMTLKSGEKVLNNLA